MTGFILAAFYLLLYFLTGSLLTARLDKERFSPAHTCIVGFFFYYLLFTVVALPMKLLLQPLSYVTYTWAVVIIVIVVFSIARNWRVWRKWLKVETKRKYWKVYAGVAVLVLIHIALIHQNAGMGSPMDATYYIGEVGSSVATNTISQYEPFSGMKYDQLQPEYMLVTYQTHSMAMCQLFGVNPLIEMRTGMMTVVIVLFHMILLQIMTAVMKKCNAYTFLAVAMADLILMLDYSIYTVSGFYFYRTYEGKTVLAVIVISSLLYFYIRVVQDAKSPGNWWYLLLMVLTSSVFAMSGMFIIPVFLFTTLTGLALSRKDMGIFKKMVGILIPSVVLILCYLLISQGGFVVMIPA